MKTVVITSTMVGAGALSMKKLRYTPRNEAETATRTEVRSIRPKRLVSKNAMAPGAIRRAMVRMMPVAFNAPTMVKDSIARSP